MHHTVLNKDQYRKIQNLYSDDTDFIGVHFLVLQILSGYDETSVKNSLARKKYVLPFDTGNCQIILTGMPQHVYQEKYGWTQENLLNCFAFSFQPAVKELLDDSGYTGDSYISLFDRPKFFVTIFSPKADSHHRAAEEIAAKINDYLQNIYIGTLFDGDDSSSNFTVLSGPIHRFDHISPEFFKVCEQKSYHYFIRKCMAVSQDWITAHRKRFIHAGYNKVKKDFLTELMQNKTKNLQEYIRILFHDFVIPSYDFYEMRELLHFLEGNLRIYSMVYKQEDKIDLSRFDYSSYSYADDCYAAICEVLSQVTETVSSRSTYSDVIVNTLTYISMNYAGPITIDEIADSVHLSPTYLSYIVAKETGTTIHQHILNIRMENAEKLLIESDLSVSQISHKVGYHTVKYFSKKFKEHTGKTPSKYRKEIRSIP